jgi:hypothetical protein
MAERNLTAREGRFLGLYLAAAAIILVFIFRATSTRCCGAITIALMELTETVATMTGVVLLARSHGAGPGPLCCASGRGPTPSCLSTALLMSRPPKKPAAEAAPPPKMASWAIYRLKGTPAALLL